MFIFKFLHIKKYQDLIQIKRPIQESPQYISESAKRSKAALPISRVYRFKLPVQAYALAHRPYTLYSVSLGHQR
jgi:hypothetical protein